MHAGNGDMGDLGERFIACFDPPLDDAGLPAEPAFRHAMRAYRRWAVSDVLSYSAEDAAVPRGAAMPHWAGTVCRPEPRRQAPAPGHAVSDFTPSPPSGFGPPAAISCRTVAVGRCRAIEMSG
jgi:hypothetical protein